MARCDACNNKAASDCDYGLCGGCCTYGACYRHGWFEYQCQTCNRLFENENNLNQHMRTHLPRNKMCPACGKAYSSISSVTMHVEGGHCSVCQGRGAAIVHDFMRQNAPHFFRPALCDASETSEESNGDEPYCRLCDRSFKNFGALLQHQEAKHASQQAPKLALRNGYY
ncbi:unnamed protein product [Durusdinium trenchii]|uniref:Zinc finger protein 521 (Early hematopoietic zinc finger protein) (LYST-interacting protein 3) n=2 Tax=Durusdinium trenchii TaxID=1381693 RepID=A0ABP0I5V0_9DINO